MAYHTISLLLYCAKFRFSESFLAPFLRQIFPNRNRIHVIHKHLRSPPRKLLNFNFINYRKRLQCMGTRVLHVSSRFLNKKQSLFIIPFQETLVFRFSSTSLARRHFSLYFQRKSLSASIRCHSIVRCHSFGSLSFSARHDSDKTYILVQPRNLVY